MTTAIETRRANANSDTPATRAVASSPAPARDVKSEAAFGDVVLTILEARGAATARELARESGVSELIVRSVLQALTTVGFLQFRPESGTYSHFCEWPRPADRSEIATEGASSWQI